MKRFYNIFTMFQITRKIVNMKEFTKELSPPEKVELFFLVCWGVFCLVFGCFFLNQDLFLLRNDT